MVTIGNNDYVDLESAKLLKELGFDKRCTYAYCTSVMHNGREITFDEECDLKGEGRGDEIEYVTGGTMIDLAYKNDSDYTSDPFAVPTLSQVVDWLLENENLYVSVSPIYLDEKLAWKANVYQLGIVFMNYIVLDYKHCDTMKEALSDGIFKTLTYIKKERQEII